jgi:hypothetical protein
MDNRSYKVGKLTGMPIEWEDTITRYKITPTQFNIVDQKQGTFEAPIGTEIEELIKIIETPSIVDDLRRQLNEKAKTDLCSESYIYRIKKTRYSYNKPIFKFYRINPHYFITYNHDTNIWRFIISGRH